jgi:hypothetical protein
VKVQNPQLQSAQPVGAPISVLRVPFTLRRWRERAGREPRGSWLRQVLRRFLTGRIGEILEEIRIRPQHEPRVVGTQSGLIGLHGAVEGEEIGILAKGFGEDPVAFGIALAADLPRLRLRHYDGDVSIGLGTDLLVLLVALAAYGRRLTPRGSG